MPWPGVPSAEDHQLFEDLGRPVSEGGPEVGGGSVRMTFMQHTLITFCEIGVTN